VIAELSKAAGFIRDATRDTTRNRFWVVRAQGGLFRVENNQWIPVTRAAAATLPGHSPADASTPYGRSVPPWYPVALLASGLLLVIEPRRRKDNEPLPPEQEALQVQGHRFRWQRTQFRARVRPHWSTTGSDRSRRFRHRESRYGRQATLTGEPDALGLGIIATGLDFFLRNERTKPPLVLAINGRWGAAARVR
jgi:hypothetical protein